MKRASRSTVVARSAALVTLFVPTLTLADTSADHAHFFDGDMMGFGLMMMLGPVFLVILVAIVVTAIVLAFRPSGAAGPSHPKTPLDILKERFARGEIEQDEFETRRRTLGE